MTIGLTTTKLLKKYEQSRQPQGFLSSFFTVDSESFHTSSEVAYDVIRTEEDVAVPLPDKSTGYHEISMDQYTAKEFKVPVYKLSIPIKAVDQQHRQAGNNPFEDPNFLASAMDQAARGYRKITNMIKRAVELQASQIWQTGKVDLIDRVNNSVYTLDFKPKSTHFPTAVTPWSTADAPILNDLKLLANVIRTDGQSETNEMTIIADQDSLEFAFANTAFMSRFNDRRADFGSIVQLPRNAPGALYRGVLDVGNYKFDIWSYDASYKHPYSGTMTKFVARKSVIMFSPDVNFHATFGAIPRIVPPDARTMPFIPSTLGGVNEGIMLSPNAWISPDGETVWVGAGNRPLLLPKSIDRFGCLDTDLA